MEFHTLTYHADGAVATITLDRPDRLNAIDDAMPGEIAAPVDQAEADDDVHVIVVTGGGRAFSAGYDLKEYAEAKDAIYSQEMPWDPMLDYRLMSRDTDHFMRLFHSAQANHRKGTRLRSGWRLRHRPRLPPRHHGGGCAHRLSTGAGVGVSFDGDVGLSDRT